MTKRQFSIIFTLMALIVCVGVLASKLNKDGFNDPGDLGAVLQQNDDEITDEEKETLSTQDYFYNMRAAKEQEDSLYVENLESIKNDETTSQEQKDIANQKLIDKTNIKAQESSVEQDIKNQGYEDAICMIDNNKVKVYVKVDEDLTKEESGLIQKSVEAQTALLKKALKVLKTGGEMIYSTCSVLESENEKVLENVLRTAKAQIVPINLDKAQFPLLDVKIPGTICVCPNEYFEGFFIAKIKKM